MIQLRQHQNEAHSSSVTAFESGVSRITLEMATGTGKSYTQGALLDDRLERGDQVLAVFVPSQDLVAQNAKSYRRFLADRGHDVNVVGVFSPDEELMREGCDLVSTNADEVLAATGQGKPTIILATYASSETMMEACEKGLAIDTMMCDEAHRMASGSDLDDAGKWSLPLFDDKIPAQRRAFYTATMRGEDREDVITMSNAELFGDRVYSLGYKEAVDRGILEQYKPFPVTIERAEIEQAMAEAGIEREEDMSDSAWRNQERAFAAALMSEAALENRRAAGEPLSMMTLHPNRKIATTYNGVLAERFADKGETLPTMVVHGAATEEKEKALAIGRSLKGEMAVSVVDMFREGTDMPGLNTLMVARNSKSSILLVQAMGRVVRKYSDDWKDENGNLPEKTPHIYVPVIVDSRDPNDKPDCALASQLFAAMLRADDGARESFEQACAQEGRDMIVGKQMGEGEAEPKMATQDVIAQAFQLDPDSPTMRALSQSIAEAARSNETIGQFDRFAGQYEAWLETNNYEAPSLPGKQEWKAADTPEKQAALKTRSDLAMWHSAVVNKHAQRRLYPEEAKRLYAIKGFSLRERDSAPEKLVQHFEAYRGYMGKNPQEPSARPWATPEGRLARLIVESGQIAAQGERLDARGRPQPRQKGDTALGEFAQALATRQALRGEIPSMVQIDKPVSVKGTLTEVTCPETGKNRLCLVPSRGEKVPGREWTGRFFQAPLPLEVSSRQEDLFRENLGMETRFTVTPGRRGVQAEMMIQVASEMNTEWAGFVDVVKRQPLGTSFGAKAFEGKMAAQPHRGKEVPGWSDKTNADLVKTAARARRLHASGELDMNVVRALDKAPGFAWVETEDYGQTIGAGKKAVPQPQKAFEEMHKRHGAALADKSLMTQDTGVANTARAGRDLILRARAARAQAVALGEDRAGKAQMAMWKKATQVMEPAMPAFKAWASWTLEQPETEKKVEKMPRKAVAVR